MGTVALKPARVPHGCPSHIREHGARTSACRHTFPCLPCTAAFSPHTSLWCHCPPVMYVSIPSSGGTGQQPSPCPFSPREGTPQQPPKGELQPVWLGANPAGIPLR